MLRQFSIPDDMHMNFIHAQAYLMIIIGISFMSKHPWWMLIGILSMSKHTWWWWGFDQCTSILVDDHRDLINVSKPIFCHDDKKLVTMTIPIVIVTKIWSRWQKIGHATIPIVIVTKFLSRWQKIGHATIPIVIATNFLSSWPNFCHDDKKLVTRQKIKKQKERP